MIVSERSASRPATFQSWMFGPASGEEAPVPPAADLAPHPPSQIRARRILVIEDNQDAAQTLGDYLELVGHEVCLAFTGPSGVEAAYQFLPDVVLCDLGLPGMSGWEVAQALRSTQSTSGARLIAITGYGTDEDRRKSTEAGFETHLTKPIDVDVLELLLSRGS